MNWWRLAILFALKYGFSFGITNLAAFIVSPISAKYGSKIGVLKLCTLGFYINAASCICFGFLTYTQNKATFIGLSYLLRLVLELLNACSAISNGPSQLEKAVIKGSFKPFNQIKNRLSINFILHSYELIRMSLYWNCFQVLHRNRRCPFIQLSYSTLDGNFPKQGNISAGVRRNNYQSWVLHR